MSKKTLIGVAISVVLIIGLFLLFKFTNVSKKSQPGPISNQISGQIAEIKDNSIIIKGTIILSKPTSAPPMKRTIEVAIAPDTIIQKIVYVIPKNTKPGVSYTPQTEKITITLKDLAVGQNVSLQTKENLFATAKVTAVNIYYETIAQPK